MKTKTTVIFAVMFFAAATVFAQSGNGWPSAAQLTQYGVGGLNQPAGTTGAGWRLQPNMYSYPAIVIWCNGAAAANTAAKNYFQDWKVVYDRSTGSATDICYEKMNARVYYKYDGREIQIIAGNFIEIGGAWPSASAWGRYGLSGFTMPPNAIIESVEDDGGQITVNFISGGKAAYANLSSQLIANNITVIDTLSDNDKEQSQTFYNERSNVVVYLNRNGDSVWIEVFKP